MLIDAVLYHTQIRIINTMLSDMEMNIIFALFVVEKAFEGESMHIDCTKEKQLNIISAKYGFGVCKSTRSLEASKSMYVSPGSCVSSSA